jgi:3-oxoacyl-[acyl-carrier protein] reductase
MRPLSGIGKATAIELGKQGWTVVITARDEGNLKKTASEIESHLIVAGDLTDPSFVERLFSETAQKFGELTRRCELDTDS